MSNLIKYRYAFDEKENVIDCSLLSEENRKDYYCIGCNNPVRPFMGEKNRKHFRHISKVECSGETYLHYLSKKIFYQKYKKHLSENIPFFIAYRQKRRCIACNYGPCMIKSTIEKFDLTSAFKDIKCEKKEGCFIPDVCILGDDDNHIFIEIAVHHKSSEKKITSGNRIIEYNINSEENLELLNREFIEEIDKKITYYNFLRKTKDVKALEECTKQIYLFILYPSGKSRIESIPVFKFKGIPVLNSHYIKRVKHPSDFVKEVVKAHLEGYYIKNCFLCRYHGIYDSYQWNFNNDPIFCKFLKEGCSSNKAANCKYFKADQKVFLKFLNVG